MVKKYAVNKKIRSEFGESNLIKFEFGVNSIQVFFICKFINIKFRPKERVTYWNLHNYMHNDLNKLPKHKRMLLLNFLEYEL